MVCRRAQKHIIFMLRFLIWHPSLALSFQSEQNRRVWESLMRELSYGVLKLLFDWLIINHTSRFQINKKMFIGFSIREKKKISRLLTRIRKDNISCFQINKKMFIGFSIREKKKISRLVTRIRKENSCSQLYFCKQLEKLLAKALNRTVLWSVN